MEIFSGRVWCGPMPNTNSAVMEKKSTQIHLILSNLSKLEIREPKILIFVKFLDLTTLKREWQDQADIVFVTKSNYVYDVLPPLTLICPKKKISKYSNIINGYFVSLPQNLWCHQNLELCSLYKWNHWKDNAVYPIETTIHHRIKIKQSLTWGCVYVCTHAAHDSQR